MHANPSGLHNLLIATISVCVITCMDDNLLLQKLVAGQKGLVVG